MDTEKLIKLAIQNRRSAQKEIYDKYSPVAFAIIRRYVKCEFEAEDVLMETFMKVFENLHSFRNKGSFEGWINKIAVREALMWLRRNKVLNMFIEADNIEIADTVKIDSKLEFEDLLKILDLLPPGYRTVFNLYEIEGHKHSEIADMLEISVNTSKSQLRLAKERLKKIIRDQNKINTA